MLKAWCFQCFLFCLLFCNFKLGGGGGYQEAFPRSSEALGLLHEAWLGRQRHQGWGQAAEANPRAKAEVRGGQQGLEDADKAEGGAAVGDEVDLVAVRTQEGGNLLQRFGPGNTPKNIIILHFKCTNIGLLCLSRLQILYDIYFPCLLRLHIIWIIGLLTEYLSI